MVQKEPKTQSERILRHMQMGMKITPYEALTLYGCMRLAARVSDLRKDGHRIMVDRGKANGGGMFAVYWMENDTAQS